MPAHKKNFEPKIEEEKKEEQVIQKPEIKNEEKIAEEKIDEVKDTAVVKEEVKEEKAPDASEQTPSLDPLSDFKEKVKEELSSPYDTHRKNFMWPILLIFVIAILFLAGVFLYKSQLKMAQDKVNVVSLAEKPTVTPEPTKAVDLTAYEIEIQNGSGISGEAAKQKEIFEEKGFVISSIGNADTSDYADTIIQAKSNVDKTFIEKLKEFLSETYTVEVETLSDDSSSEIIVILGTKK